MGRNRKFVQILASTQDSDAAGTNEIDMGPYIHTGVREVEGVWVVKDLGAATDTDHTFDMHFEESATTVGTDFSDITGASFTQVTTAGDETAEQISFTVKKRYLRGYAAQAGTAVDYWSFLGVIVEPRFDT